MPRDARRRVCFVTGTRAEFGLMSSTLRAMRDDTRIDLQIIATGMHTHRSRGYTLDEIRRGGWKVDAVVRWAEDDSPRGIARAMGAATARMAELFAELKSDVVLIVGDRVEAFAAASAAHVGGQIVAHVHGGDRALGQVDDALRHAISKLAHVHFTATKQSGDRLFAMGEDRRRIHVVGAPGIDGIRKEARRGTGFQPVSILGASGNTRVESPCHECAVVLLHPTQADDGGEVLHTRLLIDLARRHFGTSLLALMPNNDPGSAGIITALRASAAADEVRLIAHVGRPEFLVLLRDCRALIGNSSAGIIEAGSFGTPVLDVGPRQQGRERGPNVRHVEWDAAKIERAMKAIVRAKRGRPADNPYERRGGGAGRRIASTLATMTIDESLRRKLIRY